MRRFFICLSVIIITASAMLPVKASVSFSDIDSESWYAEYILSLAETGIVNGFPDGSFRPDETLDADQFIKMTVAALGFELENGTNYWASTYIECADHNGLLENVDIKNYKKPLQRGEIVCIISKALDILDENIEIEACGLYDLYGYTPEKYVPHVLKTINAGIITGYPNRTFRYDRYISRAEACAAIYKLVTPINRRERQITSLTPVPVCYSYIKGDFEEKINEYEGNKGCFSDGEIITDGQFVLQTDFNPKINDTAADVMKLLYDGISYPVFTFSPLADKTVLSFDCFDAETFSRDRLYSMFSLHLYDSLTGYTETQWGYDTMFAKLEINRLSAEGLLNKDTGRPDVYYEYKVRSLMRIMFGIETGDIFSDFIIDKYIEYAGYRAGGIPSAVNLVIAGGHKMIFFSEGEGRQMCFTFSED